MRFKIIVISTIAILVFSIVLFSNSYFNYKNANKKLNVILQEVKLENNLLQSKLKKAEKIAIERIDEPFEKFYRLGKLKKLSNTHWISSYENLINKRLLLQTKLNILRSTSCIMTRYTFKKDAITNQIFFGSIAYLESLTENYKLSFNGNETRLSGNGEYKVYSPDSINILFQKFSFNYVKNKIDTTTKQITLRYN